MRVCLCVRVSVCVLGLQLYGMLVFFICLYLNKGVYGGDLIRLYMNVVTCGNILKSTSELLEHFEMQLLHAGARACANTPAHETHSKVLDT